MAFNRNALLVLATLLAAPSSGWAQQTTAEKQRVYVCERPTPARHVTHREHGRLQFVSAKQLISGTRAQAEPLCITAAELERYRALVARQQREIASR